MVSPRSVIGFLRSELLKRRPRRPEEARFSCFFLEFHIVELLPPRRQNLSGKRKFFPFFYCTFPKTCPPNRSNPQDLGAGEQEFRGAELKKSLCMIPLSDACGATSPGGRGFVGTFP